MSAQASNAFYICCQPIGIIQGLRRRLHALGLTLNETQDVQQSTSNNNPMKPPRNRIRRRRRLRPPTPREGQVLPVSGQLGSGTLNKLNTSHNDIRNNEGPFTPSWTLPRPPVQPFTLHLPDDVLRTIFEYAATDLDSACALVLVASHVRTWVNPLLYSRIRLEGLEAIRLFARTVEDTILAETVTADLQEDSSVQLSRLYKPPSFFGCVRSLAIIPQEERVLLFFRDAVRNANIIIAACFNVVELEASGDFLRRTSVSAELLEPPDVGAGDGDSAEISTAGPNSTGPATPISAPQGLEQALMRPLFLTLVPPIQNVNFRLPILSNLTHVHYSSTLPRTLNYQGTLLALTHVAFDYPLGTTLKAEALLLLLRTALSYGEPAVIDPSHEDSNSHSTTPSDAEDQLAQIPIAPRLTMVAVRVLLRPRIKDSDRVGEVWRQLARLGQTDFRLVYFESQGLFGEDIWEKARVASRSRERLSASWYRESP